MTGDTCVAIETVNAISDAELRLWNPQVDEACSNIQIGLAYCVFGPPIFTTPTSFPSIVSSGTITTIPSATPSDIAPGTITTGCSMYYQVESGDSCEVIFNEFSITLSQFIVWNPEVPGDSCSAIFMEFSITLDDFITWNLEVNNQCTNIQGGLSYCVAGAVDTSTTTTATSVAASPTASGTITTSCDMYYIVISGDSCAVIDDRFGITFAQFQAWNPEVDDQCGNIVPGLQYCVSGPSTISSSTATIISAAATGSGTITPAQGCTQYYTVQSGDFCASIEVEFGISSAQFLAWNPEIDQECTNLQLDVQYCVSGP
ncbi:hypothetical protein PUNSTDRAFT_128887 [Punctularia strigosozonata HHB-11173 SS5]|uniref:uncharacterized protein n=1 Tax=Punctularia strigosozonata (strain HHB-11173) TaxID=741275 RepID=UPI0004417119|nr:uncharacterized protein PUNSTDRAFT_128887 [Punctularia strigosozonata HHB-11173 SS5]EIN13197.1 hypothetical protein PUNSTDRAFT_128887 [Punctularia strigosozonata HHB-11173 SS5]